MHTWPYCFYIIQKYIKELRMLMNNIINCLNINDLHILPSSEIQSSVLPYKIMSRMCRPSPFEHRVFNRKCTIIVYSCPRRLSVYSYSSWISLDNISWIILKSYMQVSLVASRGWSKCCSWSNCLGLCWGKCWGNSRCLCLTLCLCRGLSLSLSSCRCLSLCLSRSDCGCLSLRLSLGLSLCLSLGLSRSNSRSLG